LSSNLGTEWPNLKTNSDYDFWKAQWNNHGTCSSFSTRPLDYFQLALNILKKSMKPLDAILIAGKIVPKNSGTYPKTDFNMTIFNSVSAYPQLHCLTDPKGDYYLVEIRLCLDHSGASYINCTRPSNTCGTDIKWPL
jgi:ribonuclease I